MGNLATDVVGTVVLLMGARHDVRKKYTLNRTYASLKKLAKMHNHL